MKLAVFYGEEVNSYILRCEEDDPKKQKKWAPDHHQISLSNEFCFGWKEIDNGSGAWYMGSIWIIGLSQLTRQQLKDILRDISKSLGKNIYGTTLDNSIQCIETKMNKIIHYIISNCPIILKDVRWEWCDLPMTKSRIKTILAAEQKIMLKDKSN